MLWVCDFVGYCQCYKSPTQTVVKSGIIIRDFKGTPLKRAPIYFYGSDDSAQSAAELFEEIRDAIIKLAYIRFNGFATGNGAAYCLGFVSGLQEQLRSSQLRLEASDAQTTALVLADKKNQLALQDRSRDWLDAKHGIKLRSRSSSFGGYKDTKGASAAGRKDGRNYSAEKRTPKGRRLA